MQWIGVSHVLDDVCTPDCFPPTASQPPAVIAVPHAYSHLLTGIERSYLLPGGGTGSVTGFPCPFMSHFAVRDAVSVDVYAFLRLPHAHMVVRQPSFAFRFAGAYAGAPVAQSAPRISSPTPFPPRSRHPTQDESDSFTSWQTVIEQLRMYMDVQGALLRLRSMIGESFAMELGCTFATIFR